MPPNGSGSENHLPPSSSPVYNGNRDRKSLRSLLRSVKEEAERNAIARALEETGWNRKAAARLLKTSYRTVLYKIEQYHMTASDSSLPSSGPSLGTRSVESNNAGHEKVQMGSPNLGA
jgi:DNA-binding NtrC family response regulator